MEMITDTKLADRVAATLKIMNIQSAPNLDVLEFAELWQRERETEAVTLKRSLDTAIHRLQKKPRWTRNK